jgi:restriction system protein
MGRRTNLMDDLMEIGSRLPWGAAVTLAAVVFVTLHILAGTVPAAPHSPNGLGQFAGRQFLVTIASIFQYVIPFALLIGAITSFLRRRRNFKLLADASNDPVRSINSLSWQDFERLVGAGFERQGFAVAHTGGGGADGGVDLTLTKGREVALVQCKQWRAQKVGVTIVRELYGVMAAKRAARGIVVTAGEFTPDARDFAAGRNIELLNGSALAAILQATRRPDVVTSPPSSPSCPKCGSIMIARVARRGPTAGESFWGCNSYPKCRATLPIEERRAMTS